MGPLSASMYGSPDSVNIERFFLQNANDSILGKLKGCQKCAGPSMNYLPSAHLKCLGKRWFSRPRADR